MKKFTNARIYRQHDEPREIVLDKGVIRQIGKVVDVRFWDYETFAWRCRMQRHECRDEIVLVNEARWFLSRDDLAEHAAGQTRVSTFDVAIFAVVTT